MSGRHHSGLLTSVAGYWPETSYLHAVMVMEGGSSVGDGDDNMENEEVDTESR